MYKTAGKRVHLGKPVDLVGPVRVPAKTKPKAKPKRGSNRVSVRRAKKRLRKLRRIEKAARKATRKSNQKPVVDAATRARLIVQSDGPRPSDKLFLRMGGRTKKGRTV